MAEKGGKVSIRRENLSIQGSDLAPLKRPLPIHIESIASSPPIIPRMEPMIQPPPRKSARKANRIIVPPAMTC